MIKQVNTLAIIPIKIINLYIIEMAKKIIRLTEEDIHNLIRESVNKILLKETNKLYNEWYEEEDYNGHTGEPGMIRSYDIGTYYDSNAEVDAKENGFDNLEDYLKYYFDEIKTECPWYWQKIGPGYGYHGNTIFKEGGIVCKEIYGQIMFDEYPLFAGVA